MQPSNPQPQPGQQNQQIPIKISDDTLKGVYSNQAMIRHTMQEFIMDFINFVPGDPQAMLNSRVILSPQHAKALLEALQQNIKGYEDKFGKIESGSNVQGTNNFGFRTE